MLRRRIVSFASVVLLAGLLAGADHVDSPGVVEDPASDITDLYAWLGDDGTKVELAMAISAATFAPGIQYVFHVGSAPRFGDPPSSETAIICTFDEDQNATCWVGDQVRISGNAQQAPGITSDDGRVRLFTGLREDAFFFNAGGFSKTVADVKKAAPALSADPAGCPELDQATASTLAAGLAQGALGGPPEDLFVGSVAMIVMEVDEALLTGGGPILSVYASTRR